MSLDAAVRGHRRATKEQGNSSEGEAAPLPDTKGGRRAASLVFALPTVIALAFIVTGIGDRQLWRDEHATWWASSLSLADLSQLIRSIDIVFTPYYVLMHLWISVAGDSPTALRIPGALGMAAAAGLLGLLGRRMFTTRVGLIAGVAFAVLPPVTRYGQEVRPYAFAVAAVLLSTLLLARALAEPTFKVWAAYTFSIPLIGFSHLASLAVLAAHLVMVVQARKAGDKIVGWAYTAAGVLGLCFVLPMALQGTGQSGQISWNNPTAHDLVDLPKQLFGTWTVAAPVLIAGLVGLAFAGRRALTLGLWVILPPLLTYATAAQLHLFLARYLLFTAPAWVLLAAVALGRLGGPVSGPRAGAGSSPLRIAGWALAAVAVAGLTWQALPAVRDARGPIAGEPDYRGAAHYIQARQRSGDGIAYSGIMAERRAMDYELRDDPHSPRDVLMYRTPQQMASYGAAECPNPVSCLAKTERLWLVATSLDGNPYSQMPHKTAAALQKYFRVKTTKKLTGVQVVQFTRADEKSGNGDDEAAGREVHT
ncbi:glycosyltransferase family 39 protein [Streptomyces tsukubensis]|uniref:glycosyltransferase family 39 protein n=1 Tax=Streptomyces tsukubensis TaxID=83656 RepID=UPI0021182861|nr:glycosyltransferase family 39 protein [Streptomyces tsukubensis]